jgi:hypothetical protein
VKEKFLNEGNQIHNFIDSSGSGTVINYGSGSDILTSYGSGSGSTRLPEVRENAALVVEQRRRIVSCELQLLPVLLADDRGLLGCQPVRKKMSEVRLSDRDQCCGTGSDLFWEAGSESTLE